MIETTSATARVVIHDNLVAEEYLDERYCWHVFLGDGFLAHGQAPSQPEAIIEAMRIVQQIDKPQPITHSRQIRPQVEIRVKVEGILFV